MNEEDLMEKKGCCGGGCCGDEEKMTCDGGACGGCAPENVCRKKEEDGSDTFVCCDEKTEK